jgi:hypothetical protein
MSGCLRGREIVAAIRMRGRGEPRLAHIIVPSRWSKSQALRYIRREHPDDTVRLVDWMPSGTPSDPWQQRLWIANPDGFRDYPRALEEKAS